MVLHTTIWNNSAPAMMQTVKIRLELIIYEYFET